MYAQRKQWPLTGVKVELAYNPDGKPESGTDIKRRVELLGELDDAQRQRLLQIANACPIHKALTGEVRGTGLQRLVAPSVEGLHLRLSKPRSDAGAST